MEKGREKFLLNWGLVSKYRTELMGIAAILILIFHSTMTRADGKIFCDSLYNNYGIITKLLFHIVNQLNIGVEFFLFVSGVGLYFSYEKKPKFKDFYIKRIINVYFMCAIITLLMQLCIIGFTNMSFKNLILHTFSLTWLLGINITNWYVSFIMIIYLVFPLLYKFVKSFETKKHAKIIVAVIIAIYMIAIVSLGETAFVKKYEIGLTRVPIFFAGLFSGYLVKNKKTITLEAYLFVICGIAIKTLNIVSPTLDISNRLAMFFVFYAFLIVSLYIFRFLPEWIMKLLRITGEMSLELYIVHGIIHVFFASRYYNYCNAFTYFLTILIAIPISWIFSKLRKMLNKKYTVYHNKKLNS